LGKKNKKVTKKSEKVKTDQQKGTCGEREKEGEGALFFTEGVAGFGNKQPLKRQGKRGRGKYFEGKKEEN